MLNSFSNQLSLKAQDNQKKIENWFAFCSDEHAKYQKIIEIGSQLPSLAPEHKVQSNIVEGCQSIVYLHCDQKIDGNLYFEASSEALISSGLAMLAVTAYSGLSPEEVLKTPPSFVEKLGLGKSLTPGRSNGLASILTIIKKKSLSYILTANKTKLI